MSGFSKKGETVQAQIPGPGAILGKERENRNLELQKVATMLHLTVQTVRSLEADAYNDLPARVFVRGYLRNYARLMELPETDILASFDNLCPDKECIRVLPEVSASMGSENRNYQHLLRIGIWLTAAVIVGLVIFALLEPLSNAWETLQTMGDASESENGDPDQLQLPEVIETSLLADTTAVEQQVAAESESQPMADTEAVTPVTLAAQSVGFVIHFTGAAWVDVKDSSGQYQLNGDMQAGSTVQLQGTPPYRVRLSDYQQVAINIDGQSYDLSPHIKTPGSSDKVYLEFELRAP